MTAAVPDPRFRDQLAEDVAQFVVSYTRGERAWTRMGDTARGIYRSGARNFVVDALMPTIAAEVEARVQAAANQRAVEELRAIGRAGLAADPGNHPVRVPVSYLFDRAAALASPAPAPHAEDRQR